MLHTHEKLCNRKSFDRSIFHMANERAKIFIFDHKLLRVLYSRAQNLFSKNGCATLHSTNNKFHRSHESIATTGAVWMDENRKTNSSRRPSITRSAEMRAAIIFIANCRCNIDSHVCTLYKSYRVQIFGTQRMHDRWWRLAQPNNNDDDNEDENERWWRVRVVYSMW